LDPRFIRNKSISIDNRTYLLATVLPSFFRTHQQEVLAYLKRKDPAAVASAVAKAAPLSSSSLASSSSSSSAAAKGKVRVFAFEDDGSDEEDDEALRGAEGAAEFGGPNERDVVVVEFFAKEGRLGFTIGTQVAVSRIVGFFIGIASGLAVSNEVDFHNDWLIGSGLMGIQ
jgi:hypothetical protein